MSIRNVRKQMSRYAAVLGLLLAGAGLSGCSHPKFAALPPTMGASSGEHAAVMAAPASQAGPAPREVATSITPSAAPATTGSSFVSQPSVFHVGDSLTVVYTDTPQPTPMFQGKVKDDGTITLLLNHKFMAAGKTPGQLEEEIRAYYVPNYFKYLTATVNQVESTQWYYVYGEVRIPNRQIHNHSLRLLQAITSAGGFTDFAKRTKVKVTRVDGRSLEVNCNKAQSDPRLDVEIYPGDTIYVPRKLW
jgi:protein involved in polysaccharide export with SLBB domain